MAIACFAGDLSAEEQGLVYATHIAPALDLLLEKHDGGIAWRSKPSWSIVATEDRTVQPDLERFAAKRMGATTREVRSSHVPMLSHPKEVLEVIRSVSVAVQTSMVALGRVVRSRAGLAAAPMGATLLLEKR